MKKTFLQIKKTIGLAFAGACVMFSTFGSAQAQCSVTLNPTADTYASSLTNPNNTNTNYGSGIGLPAGTWTWSGNVGSVRSFLQFNLSTIPANATITSATLNLYAVPQSFFLGVGHQVSGGNSAAIINPVTAAWVENSLTWNNQPAVNAGTSAALAAHTTLNQSYAVNVLAMVQSMHASPATNFGFRLKQNVEAQYACLQFASRENATSTVRPTLVVNYTLPAGTITGNTTVCVNQYTPLSHAVSGGTWSSANASIATVNNFGLVQGVSAGNTNILYTYNVGTCPVTASIPVTVNGTVVFTITGPSTLCPNTSGNAYSVTPAVVGADYTWNIQNAPSVGVNFPVNGSTNTTLSIPSALTGQFTLRCQGLNSCGASQIVSKNIDISTDVPATPIVTCSSAAGSTACDYLVVANYGSSSIQWIVNGVVQSTSPVFLRPLSTPVLCTYTSASGCKKSTWYSPVVVCTYAARMAQEIELPTDKPFLVYPNPAKGVPKIDTKNQIGTASIFDITGQLVKVIDLSDSLNSYTVEIGTPGMYTIHIKTDAETKAYKIVVE